MEEILSISIIALCLFDGYEYLYGRRGRVPRMDRKPPPPRKYRSGSHDSPFIYQYCDFSDAIKRLEKEGLGTFESPYIVNNDIYDRMIEIQKEEAVSITEDEFSFEYKDNSSSASNAMNDTMMRYNYFKQKEKEEELNKR